MWAKRLKDKNFRLNFKSLELKNLALLFFLKNPTLEGSARMIAFKSFLKKNKRGFRTQIKNRCVMSLRSRSPLRLFRVSRVFFRQAASNGTLLGIKKSSW